jgi:hypothetical protein
MTAMSNAGWDLLEGKVAIESYEAIELFPSKRKRLHVLPVA